MGLAPLASVVIANCEVGGGCRPLVSSAAFQPWRCLAVPSLRPQTTQLRQTLFVRGSTFESEENAMKMFGVAVATGLLLATVGATLADAQTVRGELRKHPRIMQAIDDIEDAISNMETAPNDFGGHKAAAIAASREAVRQLREAVEFRADEQPPAPPYPPPGGHPPQGEPRQ
jgi:hypothetical protein